MKERPILFSAPMVRAILDGQKTQTRRLMNPQPKPVYGRKIVASSVFDVLVGNVTQENEDTLMGWESPQIEWSAGMGESFSVGGCRHGDIGDRLWVKETWQLVRPTDWEGNYVESVELWDDKIPKEEPVSDAKRSKWRVWYGADLFGRDEDPTITRADRKDWMVQAWRPSIYMPRWASRILLEIVDVRVERLHAITEKDAAAEGVNPMVVLPGDVVSHVSGFAMLWDAINHDRAPWDSNPWVWVISFKRLA